MPTVNQPERYTATMILDSISPDAKRLPTIHITMPRIILAEANTHRVLSRNARSTRAVPTHRLIQEVIDNPYRPLRWLKNKPGMQATEEMTQDEAHAAEATWMQSAHSAASFANELFKYGLHKQWAGRVIEPYLFSDWLVTTSDWSNFMALRDDGAAQPEIELVAQRVRDCLDNSRPTLLMPGQWHLPYISDADWTRVGALAMHDPLEVLKKVSAARCARLSIRPFDGEDTIQAELARYDRLVHSQPVHASPVEHQATPDEMTHDFVDRNPWVSPELHGNFTGWIQARKLIPGERVETMPPRRH